MSRNWATNSSKFLKSESSYSSIDVKEFFRSFLNCFMQVNTFSWSRRLLPWVRLLSLNCVFKLSYSDFTNFNSFFNLFKFKLHSEKKLDSDVWEMVPLFYLSIFNSLDNKSIISSF